MTVATLAGVASVLLLAVLLGVVRPRRHPEVGQFYLAARQVPVWRNGAAIGSEATSAATCLGVAGLIATHDSRMFWYPVGVAAGFVLLLALVVAPLRRSGTFTVPDFAQWRLGSAVLRRMTTCVVLAVGVIILVAQLHAAGLMVRALTGAPAWGGWALVAVPSAVVALAGGMGSVTRVQAGQFWLKLVLFTGCALALWLAWRLRPVPGGRDPVAAAAELAGELAGSGSSSLPGVLTLLLACALGTMGLPHIAVRVYTAPDGRSARRSIVAAQVLLGVFLLVPLLYGVLGRAQVTRAVAADEVVLLLPATLVPGTAGDLLTGVLAAAAFSAFLSTSCGVLAAVAGAVSSCVTTAGVGSFRAAAVVVLALALAVTSSVGVGSTVLLVLVGFSLSAATFCPLLLLGIWWRRLTDLGAAAGLLAGAGVTVSLTVTDSVGLNTGLAVVCPAAFAVPVAFVVMVLISLVTPGRMPESVDLLLLRMHDPEDRSSYGSLRSSP